MSNHSENRRAIAEALEQLSAATQAQDRAIQEMGDVVREGVDDITRRAGNAEVMARDALKAATSAQARVDQLYSKSIGQRLRWLLFGGAP